MTLQRGWGRRLLLLLAGALALPLLGIAADIEVAVLQAYLADRGIAEEIAQLRSAGYEVGKPRTELVSGECGVAGCGYSTLVVQSFHTPGANPQTLSILAVVEADARGRVTSVERVDLKTRLAIGETEP